MQYKEERQLVIRLDLRASFPDDYEGDDDGFAWHEDFDKNVRPKLVAEVMRVLTASGRFKITPINRGLDTHDELEILVEHRLGAGD